MLLPTLEEQPFLTRISKFILLLMLSPVLSAQSAITANPLQELEPADSRAAYCYYNHLTAVQLASKGRNKLSVLPMLAQLQEWKAAFDRRFVDSTRRTSELAKATSYFNQQLAKYIEQQPDRTSTQVTKTSFTELVRSDCDIELAKLKQRDPIQVVTKTSQEEKKTKPIDTPQNSLWSMQNLEGSWRTTQINYRFKYANHIELVLWAARSGFTEGMAVFHQQRQRCLGILERNKNDALMFTPFEGNVCEGLAGGIFSITRAGNPMMLLFEPAESKDSASSRITNMFYVKKMTQTPNGLQSYVDRLKSNQNGLQQKITEFKSQRESRIIELRSQLKGNFQADFKESMLLGVWGGKFTDKRRAYDAEIALWSSAPRTLQQVVGLVHFADKLCDTEVIVSNLNNQFQWSMNTIQSAGDKCVPISGSGNLQMNDTQNQLAIFTNAPLSILDSVNSPQCISGIASKGLKNDCYAVGIFQRADASKELLLAVSKVGPNIITGPAKSAWDILKNNTPQLKQLRAEHDQALAENPKRLAQMHAKIKAEREQDKREFLEQERRQKEWESRRFAAKSTSNHGESSGQRSGTVRPPPIVSGPFDGVQASTFFNALYKGDFDNIRQLTRAYQEKKIQQRSDALGNKPHIMDNILNKAVRSIKLTSNFLAVYLFRYDTAYKSCLRSDAVEFEVVREYAETKILNSLGIQIAGQMGYTDRKEYTVNTEFVKAFRRIGLMQPQGGMATLSDMLLNKGGSDIRREIIAGTKQLMARFDCDSKEIQKLEENILKFRSSQ